MLKYKIGDTVYVRPGLLNGNRYGSNAVIFNSNMGTKEPLTIYEYYHIFGYRVTKNGRNWGQWVFVDEMLTDIDNDAIDLYE